MSLQIQIAAGFGTRLKEERIRLGKSQTEFAEAADVRRLAQSQYEAETTSPTVRYLSAIANAGVDLQYLLFGKRQNEMAVIATRRRTEQEIFEVLDEMEQHQGKRMAPAERYTLFEFLRDRLTDPDGGMDTAYQAPATVTPIQKARRPASKAKKAKRAS